jgi:hypothetical protein
MSDLNHFLSEEVSGKSDSQRRDLKKKPLLFTRSSNPVKISELSREKILEMLEPVMNLLPGFTANLAWTRQKVLPKNPKILPEELAGLLDIPLLEAYFILDRIHTIQSSEESD